ncbi:MAG: hypothetical protein AAF203_09405 [Pseudomonadota bacterium]
MKFIYLLALLLVSSVSYSHPVSFEGSKGIMGYHSPMLIHFQLNYSFKYWLAAGVHHFEIPNSRPDQFANFASANFLIKRWNGASYQANIYGVLGLGHAKLRESSRGAMLAKLQFDIENRKYYFLSSFSQVNTEQQTELKDAVVRFGVAPYVGSFNDIHSWIILEYRSNEIGNQNPIDDITPFLRIYYKNLLFEIGQSFNGLTRFNYITHF